MTCRILATKRFGHVICYVLVVARDDLTVFSVVAVLGVFVSAVSVDTRRTPASCVSVYTNSIYNSVARETRNVFGVGFPLLSPAHAPSVCNTLLLHWPVQGRREAGERTGQGMGVACVLHRQRVHCDRGGHQDGLQVRAGSAESTDFFLMGAYVSARCPPLPRDKGVKGIVCLREGAYT